jgi:hypothetical protein
MGCFDIGDNIIEPSRWPWGYDNAKKCMRSFPFGLYFDGVNDYVGIPDSDSIFRNGMTSLTITAFLKPDIDPKFGFVFSIGSHAPKGYNVTIGADNTVRFYAQNSSVGSRLITEQTLPQGEVSHIACVHDGDNLETRIYINGELSATGSFDTAFAFDTSNIESDDPRIGSQAKLPYQEERYFRGTIYEVALYGDRAFTKEDVGKNMVKTPDGNDDGLLFCYPLNSGSGTTVSDLSPFRNTATIYGATWVAE